MSRKRETVKKLASLSAIGAGAVGFGAGEAKANLVFTNLSPSPHVGFNNTSAKVFTTSFLAVHQIHTIHFAAVSNTSHRATGTVVHFRTVNFKGSKVSFATTHGHLAVVPQDATWGGDAAAGNGSVARRSWFQTLSHGDMGFGTRGTGPVTNEYALFRFSTGASTFDYGWINFSLTETDAFGTSGSLGPNLTILSYAYDTSGEILPAGDQEPLPEPSAFEMSGLGALALGAVGVRRWRAARKTR